MKRDVDGYIAVPLDEDGHLFRKRTSIKGAVKFTILLFAFAAIFFAAGVAVGQNWNEISLMRPQEAKEDVKLPPQSFIPQIPTKEVIFDFPSGYEETGPAADKLWDDLMPLGSGFVRIPSPRRFDMPESKTIPGDPQSAEIYSLSVTHQLHCLGVLRHVIMKYEKKDKSRFAGDGHEYHCLDYIRQSILCAGDTTLDFAAIVHGEDGIDRRLGFSGANSTHQCRDWNTIVHFAVENRSGDKTGIF